jgi:hypothetical protein
MKYRSNFNLLGLIKLANKELRPSDTSVYIIFLLAVAAGLRRKEIDLLEWAAAGSKVPFGELAKRVGNGAGDS